MCDKHNAPAAARPVAEEALVALAGELASVAGGGSVAPAVEPPGGQNGSSSAQFIGLEYKELQGKYDKLRKQCDKLEKKNTELLDFKKAVTPKLTNLTIRARREAAAFSPMDISTWDLDSSTGREAKRVE